MTKGANLSKYYAGICYLKLGNFEEAIDHLKSFKGKDNIIGPMAKGAIGDAYLELNQAAKAASYYMEAAELKDNEFTSPLFLLKAGWTYEIMKDYKKALQTYERIKLNYASSNEAREIDKYIARAKGMM
jgi:tetratricopeptide (TPR) repeat protein